MTAMGPSSAIAATGDDAVEVSPLRIEGDLPAPSVRELRSRLLDAMTNVGFELVDGDATRATRVLRTTVRVEQRDYALEVELVETDGERVLVRAEEHCDLCGLEEVADRLAGLAARDRCSTSRPCRPGRRFASTARRWGHRPSRSPSRPALTS
jgi:hypothetical protein